MRRRIIVGVCAAIALAALPAAAQLRAVSYVSGLSQPVAFVQDTADAANQYVVQQGGRIQVIRNGVLQSTPFLDLTSSITSGGERGLLGMALAPNYAASGRFYVYFNVQNGDIVIARFNRSSGNPLTADPATRVDLRWSTGERFIRHRSFSNHNGGNLAFGPDGYLYVGTGDGGSGNDPENNAQNMDSLLGKILRIDVSVANADQNGFVVPADNPFVGSSRPEIWSVGLRNPWRWSFDDPARGGTGALIIGDVGQGTREEIDYEPAGRGGRNYGWRIREGTVATPGVPATTPAFTPLTEPMFDYGRSSGGSVTGGFVYRGSAIPAYVGRYFFGDFVSGRIWSLRLTINSATGEAAASDLQDHTSELSSSSVSTFGVDANGELYFVNYNSGTISRIAPVATPPTPQPLLFVDTPSANAVLRQPFAVGGWALDRTSAANSGIAAIHVWLYPQSGAPVFAGFAAMGGARPDVGAFFGSQFNASGFGLGVRGIQPGSYTLVAFGLVAATGTFGAVQAVPIRILPSTFLAVDTPGSNAVVDRPFFLGGWAIDTAATSGPGVDVVHVWAYPAAGGAPVFAGAASFGSRPDVGAVFGAQFAGGGYGVMVSSIPAGVWDLVVFARSSVTGGFDAVQVIRVTVR